MKRKQPTKQEKLTSALLALDEARCKLDPTLKACIDRERAKSLTAQEIERQMGLEWAHVVHVAWDGDNHPTNLIPKRKAVHREETEKRDIPAIAKVKRIQKKEAERIERMRQLMLASDIKRESPNWDQKRKMAAGKAEKKWPSRPMRGGKRDTLKRGMNGKVSSRSGPRTSE